jgi:DNA helicase-2/ATP-dependent DNA helicase PcrA
LVDELRRRKIECVDNLLKSTSSTRFAAGAITHILRYLVDPQSATKLAMAYRIWRRDDREDEQKASLVDRTAEFLRKCSQVEDFLYPDGPKDWLLENNPEEDIMNELISFREISRRWVSAVLLPIDQLVLTLSQDFLTQPTDLAIAHKLAVLLRRASQTHPDWRIGELAEELAIIARNERRFIGFSGDDSGFDPDRYRGKVVVATMHKAKGLEWDRVYIMSANNYDFPSGQEYDRYISEKWFVRDRLNLEAEALRQLDHLSGQRSNPNQDQMADWYLEGAATQAARLDYVRERLRLLYVGITRARRELIATWNAGRQGNLQITMPLAHLLTLDLNGVADMKLPDLEEPDDDHWN